MAEPLKAARSAITACVTLCIVLQLLEDENAQQLSMVMAVVDRLEKLEQQLYAMQEQQDRQRRSRWGMFSLQTR